MSTQVCTVDGSSGAASDGLINPALLPAKAADLDTTDITGAADGIRAMGSTVDTKTDEIKSTWTTGLPGCYTAPEQESVYTLMDSPATASEELKTRFNSMAGYLDTYADDLGKIKPKLADFETRAQAFRDEVKDGVWVDATEAKDAGLGDYLSAFGNWISGGDQEQKKVPWYEDGDTVDKNNAFLGEIAGLYADVSSAASTCATSINGLTSLPPDERAIPPIPAEAFTNPESPMPWGNPREEDRNCPESVGHGAYQFGKSTVEGLGSLISYNPETGDWGDWGNAGQAWMNTGNVLLSLAVTSVGTVGFTQIMKATGNGDNPVVQWMDERHQVASNVVTGLVGIDLNAQDPFHKWKEDGVATFTESFLNVGTMFIPGAGQVGAGLRAASIGSRVARISAAVADFAVPGGAWLVKGGLHTIPVLKNVFKFDHVPVTALDDASRLGVRAPTMNPASVIEQITETIPPRPVTRPVSQSLFGDGPNVESPRSSVDTPEAPGVRSSTSQPDVSSTHPHSGQPHPDAVQTPTTHPETATTTHPETGTTTHPETGDSHPADHPDTQSPDTQHPDIQHPDTQHPDTQHPETQHPETQHPETQHPDTSASHAPETTGHERPEGFPAHDRHGREYSFEPDGTAHLDGDPEGSYRDANGALHGENGRFATDTNHPDASDTEVQKAETGDSHEPHLSPAEQVAHDRLVDARTEAYDAAQSTHQRLERLVATLDLPEGVLSGHTHDVAIRVRELVDRGNLGWREAQHLNRALGADRAAAHALRTASERLGDQAATAVATLRGETTVIGSGRAGAGRFDQVTLADDPPAVNVYETKGGNSALGDRTVDGVRVQQGTAGYFNDVARTDPRFLSGLRDYIARNQGSPIAAALRNGDITINYELVRARPNGSISVTRFVIDPADLKLPPLK